MNRIQRLLTLLFITCGLTTGLWASSIPGALSGRFTINASGEKVLFSQGNLQYQASTNTWRFATNQYDYIGSANANISDSYTGWIDLFGWATNGLEANTATGKMPYYTGTTNEDYGPSITSGEFDRTVYDWGKAIDDSWHTLSNAEWNYIFAGRANYSSLYGFGRLFGVNGVFLLPDDWSWSETEIATAATVAGFTWSGGAKTFTSNIISDNALWSAMQSAGAVFIPTAGYRQGTTINMSGNGGDYWSSTASSATNAYRTSFYDEHLNLSNNYGRSDGISVRLVRSSLDQDAEGYYLLGSADDWKDFAAIVNNTNPTANARMTADIDLGDDQTTIGNPGETTYNYFEGTFDGQGHTLTVHYVKQGDKDIRSPFPNISEATIKNIHITGTIESSTACQPAVIGCVRNGTSTIENVWSSVELTSTKSSWCEASGLVGCVDGYRNGHLVMTDCMISGNIISSGSYEGCFIGYINSGGSATVSNCMSVANFTYSGTSGFQGNYTNCYVKQFPSSIPAVMQVTDAQLADGTTATALQNNRAETVWVQDPLTNQPMLALFAGKYKVPTSGLGTLSAKAAFTLPEGLEAYYCKDYDTSEGTIGVVAINGVVPAETGVLLRGEPGEIYTLTTSNETPAMVTDNALVAVTEQTTIQQTEDINEVSYTNFGLSGGVFKKVNTNGGTVKANRAYLRIPTSALTPEASARGILLAWDGEPTGVESIHNSECIIHNPDGAYYTLDGRRLQAEPVRGLYIVNGKKVVIK